MADVRGEPLPTCFAHPDEDIVSAHNKCRAVEESILLALDSATLRSQRVVLNKQLINVRILGHFLTVAPSDRGKAHGGLRREIVCRLLCMHVNDRSSTALPNGSRNTEPALSGRALE